MENIRNLIAGNVSTKSVSGYWIAKFDGEGWEHGWFWRIRRKRKVIPHSRLLYKAQRDSLTMWKKAMWRIRSNVKYRGLYVSWVWMTCHLWDCSHTPLTCRRFHGGVWGGFLLRYSRRLPTASNYSSSSVDSTRWWNVSRWWRHRYHVRSGPRRWGHRVSWWKMLRLTTEIQILQHLFVLLGCEFVWNVGNLICIICALSPVFRYPFWGASNPDNHELDDEGSQTGA